MCRCTAHPLAAWFCESKERTRVARLTLTSPTFTPLACRSMILGPGLYAHTHAHLHQLRMQRMQQGTCTTQVVTIVFSRHTDASSKWGAGRALVPDFFIAMAYCRSSTSRSTAVTKMTWVMPCKHHQQLGHIL